MWYLYWGPRTGYCIFVEVQQIVFVWGFVVVIVKKEKLRDLLLEYSPASHRFVKRLV